MGIFSIGDIPRSGVSPQSLRIGLRLPGFSGSRGHNSRKWGRVSIIFDCFYVGGGEVIYSHITTGDLISGRALVREKHFLSPARKDPPHRDTLRFNAITCPSVGVHPTQARSWVVTLKTPQKARFSNPGVSGKRRKTHGFNWGQNMARNDQNGPFRVFWDMGKFSR